MKFILCLAAILLLLSIARLQTTPSREQCLAQYATCMGNNSGSAHSLRELLEERTSSAFPDLLTPPTSPVPEYVDASSCGLSGYVRSGDPALRAGHFASAQTANAMRNEFPWQVVLVRKESPLFRCSGVVIDPWWILTSAHCPLTKANTDITILFNVYRYRETTAERPPKGVFTMEINPYYIFSNVEEPVSLLLLDRPLKLDANWTVQQICLPRLLDSCRWGSCREDCDVMVSSWDDTGTFKKSMLKIPAVGEPSYALSKMDIGAPLSVIGPAVPNDAYSRFTLCGIHLNNGQYYPICNALGWITSTMQSN